MTDVAWQRIVDSAEGSFSVELPAGWQADIRLQRLGPTLRRVVRGVSPEGTVRLSLHDPDLPDFFDPGSAMFVQPPVQQVAAYVPADAFLPQYLQQRFGRAAGLRLDEVRPEPELQQQIAQQVASRGMQPRVGVVSQPFGFSEAGRPVDAVAIGSTVDFGPGWVADVCIVFTTGGARPDRDLLVHVMLSEQTDAQWQAGQNQLYAQQQALNAQQSSAWMATMQAGHAQRMGDIAAAGAANTAIHEARVAMGEASNAAFLDQVRQPVATADAPGLDQQHAAVTAIREEETVRTASGADVQVASGAEEYFVDERNRRWVGATGNVQANDFTSVGLNPDDYQQGQVRR